MAVLYVTVDRARAVCLRQPSFSFKKQKARHVDTVLYGAVMVSSVHQLLTAVYALVYCRRDRLPVRLSTGSDSVTTDHGRGVPTAHKSAFGLKAAQYPDRMEPKSHERG